MLKLAREVVMKTVTQKEFFKQIVRQKSYKAAAKTLNERAAKKVYGKNERRSVKVAS